MSRKCWNMETDGRALNKQRACCNPQVRSRSLVARAFLCQPQTAKSCLRLAQETYFLYAIRAQSLLFGPMDCKLDRLQGIHAFALAPNARSHGFGRNGAAKFQCLGIGRAVALGGDELLRNVSDS
jgi:hypothetical protein